MDVAGALLPFTQVVRPELTIHVQEVLTQADRDATDNKLKIPEINEPDKCDDDVKSPKSDYEVKPRSPKRDVNKSGYVRNGSENGDAA
ncbi:jg1467 [Pararge aegeria aegeria]|uniref:Jg1467 protein n=1 Tax=Pararge aegeria aegeria TaxID=348720 RepID=A0A8S4QMJ9_9NEOP|nr:jg1467 [Pararge aegeria aegeria]